MITFRLFRQSWKEYPLLDNTALLPNLPILWQSNVYQFCVVRSQSADSDRCHHSHLSEQRQDFLPKAYGVLVIREETHQHTIHTQVIEALEFQRHLFGGADHWQRTGAEGEHLQRELVKRAAPQVQAVGPSSSSSASLVAVAWV